MNSNAPISSDTPLAPPPPGLTSDFNHPQNDQHYYQMMVTLPIVVTFSTLCFVARIYARSVVVKQFGWDDVFATLAWLCNIGMTWSWIGEVQSGLLIFDWNVRLVDWMANDEPYWDYWNTINAFLLYYTQAFTKISVLMLYLRVMDNSRPKLRIGVYLLVFVCAAIAIICMSILLNFCQPTLKLFHPNMPGTCNIQPNLFFGQALMGVITDLLILVPPIPIIWGLPYSRPRRLGLLLIMCLGLFVTCIALARTIFAAPGITSFEYIDTGEFQDSYWAMLEVNFGIAVVCLPALNQLFRRVRRTTSPKELRRLARGARNVEVEPHAIPGRATDNGGMHVKKERSPLTRVIYGFLSEFGHTQPHDSRRACTKPSTDGSNFTGRDDGNLGESSMAIYKQGVGSVSEKSQEGSSDTCEAAPDSLRELSLKQSCEDMEGSRHQGSSAGLEDDPSQMV